MFLQFFLRDRKKKKSLILRTVITKGYSISTCCLDNRYTMVIIASCDHIVNDSMQIADIY